MLLVMIPIALSTNSTSQADAADPLVNCSQVNVDPRHIRITCNAAGVIVLNTVVLLPVVTLPPITLPGATVTVKIPPGPQPTRTITVPIPGPTKTVTTTETKTIGPSALPTDRPTATITVNRTRQPEIKYVTVEPTPKPDDNGTIINFPDSPAEVITTAGIGLLLGLIAAVAALWLGYIFGYKDAEKNEINFMRALSDRMFISRKH